MNLKSLPSGWHWAKLGDICLKIQDGAHHSPKKTSPKRMPNTYPYVTSKNIRNWSLDMEDVTYVDQTFHESIYPRCNAELGDVLLTKDGSNTGQVTINTFDEPISLLSSVCLLKPDRDKLDARFLVHYIHSEEGFESITGQMTGAAIKRIILKRVKSSEIPLPPLEEQKRIVAVLDKAFAALDRARANAEANLNDAEKLFESYVTKVISEWGEQWDEITLDEACIVQRGSSPRPIKKYFTNDPDGVNWIKIGDIGEGEKYVLSTAQKITPEGASQSRYVEPGDFILTNSMSYGRPYIMKIEGYIHDGWFVLRLRDGVDADYLYYLIASNYVQDQFSGLAAGSVVKNISSDLVKKANLPMPSLDTQREVARKFEYFAEKAERVCDRYAKKIDEIDNLRHSLLQKAFAGELT